MISDGQYKYIYNAINQLIEVKDSNGDAVIKASYDEQGRRVKTENKQGVTNYFYEGDQIIYETDASNHVTVEYTWDDEGNPVAMTKDGQTYYYHLNGHGDVVRLTDQTSNVVASYEYDAWGNILEISGPLAELTPFRYSSYHYDNETGLYYLMARYYDPTTERFLSRDPYQGDSNAPITQNSYIYAKNNPLSYVDKQGHYATAALFGTAGNAAASDGPLPFGDIVGVIILGYGFYKMYKASVSLSTGIPKKILKDNDHVDMGKFNQRLSGQERKDPGSGWSIEKDRAKGKSHGGSGWKLKDDKGKRIKTLSDTGKQLRD